MRNSFQIQPLSNEPFEGLISLSTKALADCGVIVYVADSMPGYPCRVSLRDAEVGNEVLLLNYKHLDVGTPFRSEGPIFVGRNAQRANLEPCEIPEMLRGRPLSVRGYDRAGMMVDADVTAGVELEDTIDRLFADSAIDYLHIHFAKRGCYACQVDRI